MNKYLLSTILVSLGFVNMIYTTFFLMETIEEFIMFNCGIISTLLWCAGIGILHSNKGGIK